MNQPIVELFRTIVTKTQEKILPELKAFDPAIANVNYQHGHPIEITNTLQEWTGGNKDGDKYPLIALFQDFPEDKGNSKGLIDLTLHFIIAKRTQQEYKADQRYANNFIPVLYPVYDEFMRQLYYCGYFMNAMDPKHRKFDRLYWGKNGLYGNTANVFNDMIDAIEIQDLKLTLDTRKCIQFGKTQIIS